jgi:hypothetical protein
LRFAKITSVGRDLWRADSPTHRLKRHDAKYCSNACRQKAYRARKNALRLLGPGS